MNGDPLPSERKIVILALVLFFHLIVVSTGVVLENKRTLLHNIFATITSPFQIAFQESLDWVSHQLRHYVFLKNSFKKYHILKKDYTRLKRENYLLKERIAQKEFLEEVKKKRSQFIHVDVISIDTNFPLGSLYINKGSYHGIAKDMIVLNREDQLVGKVVEPVSLFSAKIRLITGTRGGIGAYIEKNKLEGLLTGNNTRECNFKYLIENKPVAIGDRVVTSGTDRIFPPYIPIGEVVSVKKEYLTQEVRVEPFFVRSSIKQLIVIGGTDPVPEIKEQSREHDPEI